jgi:hypothetical protein
MRSKHINSNENGQPCCPFVLAQCSGVNYILQCDMAMASLYRMPFLGVSSLNFGPLPSGLFLRCALVAGPGANAQRFFRMILPAPLVIDP